MARLFRRGHSEGKKPDVTSPADEMSDLEQLAGSDKEIYEALASTMFLDPKKIEASMKQAVEYAQKAEKDDETAKSGMWFEVAGGLAIYEGNAKKVVEYFREAQRVIGRQYAILINPERAVAVAQEYYKRHLPA